MANEVFCFDSHFHIINPSFPLVENQSYLPDPFLVEDYLKSMSDLNLCMKGGAVVSGSFQAFDVSYMKDTLNKLGPNYVGVINLQHDVSDEEILVLNKIGVRAVRFNLYRGGSQALDKLESFARRIYDLVGWHVELYINNAHLHELVSVLSSLPKVCIDHLGFGGIGDDLLKLAKCGVHIKATRFSMLDFDIKNLMLKIHECNPKCLMFGSDLPSTRAPRLFNNHDLKLFLKTFDVPELKKIMYSNAYELYHGRFKSYL